MGGMNPSSNPDHHLWNNHGTWWCHFTVHRTDYTKHRVRVSLHTKDLETARHRRDLLLPAVPGIARAIPQIPPAVGAPIPSVLRRLNPRRSSFHLDVLPV
jgi:hypothetical protein